MNTVKYANFTLVTELTNTKFDLKKETIGDIFAGMYTLTLLTKDGFSGVEELKKEYEEEKLEQIKKEVKKVLKEKEEKEKIRNMVKAALIKDENV